VGSSRIKVLYLFKLNSDKITLALSQGDNNLISLVVFSAFISNLARD